MKFTRPLRQVLLCAAALSIALPPAAPAALAQPASGDGEPTAAACAELGFRTGRIGYGYNGYAPAALPVAPVMPVPADGQPDTVVEQVVTTGTFIRGVAEDAALPIEVTTRAELMRSGPRSKAPKQKVIKPDAPADAVFASRQPAPLNNSVWDSTSINRMFDDAEHYPSTRVNTIHDAQSEPVSTFSIDVDTASYTNVRRFLKDGQRPPSDSVRIEEMVNYFDYGYAPPTDKATPFATHLAVTPSPWSQGKQLMHIGIQGYKPARNDSPLNLVFLVDTSGSMDGPDRLQLAQKSLNVLIDQLRPQDHVAMVAYAGSAGEVLEPTAGGEKLKMRCAVNALQSGGSTAGGAGLDLAYNLAQENFDPKAVNRIILMTDGDFNVGMTENKSLEEFISIKRKTGVYLSIYGYGRGNYQDARMQTLAQNGNGTASYVDSLDEARKIFRKDFDGAMFPIADDVKIQVEFNPARVAEYRLVGYETRLLKREDFNNDTVDAGEIGAGVAVTALYEVTPVGGPLSSDPLRYARAAARPVGKGQELAFLKIRYKLPGEAVSKLIEKPISEAVGYATLAQAPEATRWAASVAGYGQKLAGSPYVSDAYSWDQAMTLAQGAKGDDPDGRRAEFIGLVRAAKELRTQSAGR